MTRITSLPYSQLEAGQFEAWRRIQEGDRTFDSPFFAPEFTAAVAAVRDDVFVALIECHGTIVGLFPFQHGAWGDAKAIGGDVSHFNGVIVEPGIAWNAELLLKSCHLRSWSFDYVPTSQTPFQPHFRRVGESPFIDLTNGFEEYWSEKKHSGRAIEQAARKARKLEREVGPLRFELHDSLDETFHCLLAWKSEQHRRTNVVDAFKRTWLVALLDRIRCTQTPVFSGLLSALYAGDHLVAVHLGIRSRHVVHSWYPAYNTAFSKYSPGITLLLKLAESLAAEGVQRIDLAAGEHEYKSRFMSGAIPVARGAVDRSRLKAYVRRSAAAIHERVREMPFTEPIRIPYRMLRRAGQWWTEQ